MVEWNTGDPARREMLAVRRVHAPILRCRDDLFGRVAVHEEYDRARHRRGARSVHVEEKTTIALGPVQEVALDARAGRRGKDRGCLENTSVERHQAFSRWYLPL